MSEVELTIPQPPDVLFQKERTGRVLNESSVIYLIEKIEAVEHTGVLVTYTGVPYVKKGFPTPEAIFAINQVKKIVLESTTLLKSPFFLFGILVYDKTKLCKSFNVVFDKLFGNHKLKEEFMCRSAFNMANFAHHVLCDMKVDKNTAKEFAFNIGQIFEYDDSYRYRVQDILTELDEEKFKNSSRKEIKRLYSLFKERTLNHVYLKTDKVMFLVLFATLFYGKIMAKHVTFLKQAQLDEDDRYWVSMRADHYNYLGLSTDERHKLYTERPTAYDAIA